MDNKPKKESSLGHIEIMSEIKAAEMEERPVNFSNKTITDFYVISDKVKYGLNLENAIILGPVFLGEIVVTGDLNFKNTKINGSVYLAKSEIKGNLILEDAKINGTINLVGAIIGKSIKARGFINTGFFSLTKAKVKEDVILENGEIESVNYQDLTVRGDLFIDSASIGGSLNLSKLTVEGVINLDDTEIGRDLILTEAQVYKSGIDTTTTTIEGRKII